MKKLTVLLLVFALLLTACGNSNNNKDNPDSSALNYISENPSLSMRTPETLNPIFMNQESNIQAFQLIYDSLVYIDSELRAVPYLAESCSISSGGKTLDFVLKSGITWHDGVQFTSKDVKYTIEQILNAEVPCIYTERLKNVESVSIVDDTHFSIKLKKAYLPILNLLDFPIVPSHKKDIDTTPVGTGQYKFVEYIPKKAIVLKRNDEWKIGDVPAIENLDIRILDKDKDVVSVVKLGEVSAVETDFTKAGDFGSSGTIKAIKYPTTKYEFLGFNCEHPVLSSPVVRRAISRAINRNEIAESVYFGYARPANAPIPPDSWMNNEETSLFDTALASSLLKSDGWEDIDSDGILEKTLEITNEEEGEASTTPQKIKRDFELSFTVLVNSDNLFRVQAFEALCKTLKEVGIRVTMIKTSWDDYNEKIINGKYDMFMGGYDLSASLDFEFMLGSDSSENYYKYSSEAMDNAISGLYTPASNTEIKAAYTAFQSVFTAEAPVAGLYFLDNVFIHNSKLQDVTIPSYSKIYRNINLWKYKNKGE